LKIQVNTGHDINGGEELIHRAESVVERILGHLAKHLSRIEVHISDENREKGGEHDKRCMMEARLDGHQPIAVTHEAQTYEQSIEGAADKLKSLLDHVIGRLHSP
jgi:ribosome-associated translation inhibitor RaiA